MKEGYVYLLVSLKDGSFYLGSTNDLERRLLEHNSGKMKSTRQKTPWTISTAICCKSLADARKIEQKLKSHKKKLSEKWFIQTVQQYME